MISREERHDNLILVTVSDIGSNHRILCMPNQDSAAFNYIEEDFALVLSDGVGSCKEAEQGSRYVTETCLKLLDSIKRRSLPFCSKSIVEELINSWRSLIVSENYDDYCATVKAAIKIGNQIKLISLGDGFIAVSSEGIHLSSPSEETSFTNETKCLGSHVSKNDFWTADFQLDTFKPYVVFGCTDGVANGIVSEKKIELVEDIEYNASPNKLKAELEEFVVEIGNYCYDDRTVGVVKYERKN